MQRSPRVTRQFTLSLPACRHVSQFLPKFADILSQVEGNPQAITAILYKIQKASLSLCGFPFRLGQSDFFSRIKMCPNLLGFALSNVPYRPSKVFHTNFVLVVPSEINKTIKACNFEM